MNYKLLTGTAVFAPTFLAAPPSRASGYLEHIKACINYPQTIYLAYAFQPLTIGWQSKGWLSIATGECYSFDPGLRVLQLYYSTQTDTYRKDDGELAKAAWGDLGDKSFCVEKNVHKTFSFWHTDHSDPCETAARFDNSNAKYTPEGNVAYTFTIRADGTTENFVPLD